MDFLQGYVVLSVDWYIPYLLPYKNLFTKYYLKNGELSYNLIQGNKVLYMYFTEN